MRIKVLAIIAGLHVSQGLVADEKGIALYEKTQLTMTTSAYAYISAIDELYELNDADKMYDAIGNMHITYPEDVKDNISHKVGLYLTDMRDVIAQVEDYLFHKENSDRQCTVDIENFKNNILPVYTKDLDIFNKASVLTQEEREVTWALTMAFTISGPSIGYMRLSLDTFTGCLMFDGDDFLPN